ncbi:hypothetical protein P389DRAFT_169612 [Cystobasidium minutum MCA 4210]|uniref:uncharacterized protein n=1 Tax=Cystobasidium minutum MCA 4210 TaxID=1397322 RepID=UPI0034CEB347|eukprot:jgi/Rhomi1/169612/fgenesh1_kg.3_\
MLEATMILLDNSSFAINTDYSSLSRWASQLDSAKTVFNTKINSNPENVVGIMTMAGKGPQVLASPTQDYGAIVSSLADVRLEGEVDLITSIQVAQLALKHRQNKNLRQRIIALVGSPLETTSSSDLVKLGKRLKKNNVACDIVNFGEDVANEEKLREFVEAVNSQDNSHLVSVAPGSVLLSDMIISSGMLTEDGVPASSANGAGPSGTSGGGSGGGSGEDGEFGVDPNLDPELAMALRMSLEEERARQAASQRSQEASSSSGAASNLEAIPEQPASTSTNLPPALSDSAASGPASALPVNEPSSTAAVGPTESIEGRGEAGGVKIEDVDISGMDEGDEDADLARALALSRGDAGDNNEDEDMAGHDEGGHDDDEEITEEEAMARAIAMSMQEQQDRESK